MWPRRGRAGRTGGGRDRDVRGRLAPRRRTDGRDGARRFVAVYLSLFPNVARETGLDEDFVEHLRAVFSEGGVDAAAPLVGDDVVNLLTAAGTVEDCRRRLDEYRAAGVELPVLAPVDGALELTIDALA